MMETSRQARGDRINRVTDYGNNKYKERAREEDGVEYGGACELHDGGR